MRRAWRRRRAAAAPSRRCPTASAGERPTQARCSASSPFRKRCARTPPVARPLAGNSANSLTFALPGSVPSSVSLLAAIVTTTVSAASSAGDAREVDDVRAGAEVDAGHAAGRAALRAHRGRREPQQLRIGCHEHELVGLVALHGADDLVAGLEADHLELGLVRVGAGRDALHDALLRAERDRAIGVERDDREHLLVAVRQREVVADLARRRRAAPTSAAASAGRRA